MSAITELIRRADERLRLQVKVAAGLTQAVSRERLDEMPLSEQALAEARKLLADRKEALATAQRRVQQLDDAVGQLSRALPFLAESWPWQRDRLRDAIREDTEDGLAAWLNYWFEAASSRRLTVLRRLQSEVTLPAPFGVIGERLSVAARALADDDWLPCHEVLLAGAAGVRAGTRQVPDRLAPGGREPDETVRENLRLLAARLALHNGLASQADAALGPDGSQTAPRLALRSRAARLRRGADDKGESLLARARELDPVDLDVATESITRARQNRDMHSALEIARTAVEALPSSSDVEGDTGPLVSPPTEIWVALAERARDEDDHAAARHFLDRATATAAWDDNVILAAAEEARATVTTSDAEKHRASLLAGYWSANLGQLQRARRNYESAIGEGPPADPADAQVQAAARLRLADVIAVTARQRPYRTVADELVNALGHVQQARPLTDWSGTESWSYLTESDLRIQLSRVPGRDDRYQQEWKALLAAAQAVSFRPTSPGAWLGLADAAMTRDLYLVAEAAAARANKIGQSEATRAGYIRALINTGRYTDALKLLDADDSGNLDDPWRQCVQGLIALRLGRADEAVRHFTAPRIDPAWLWAWNAYIRALVIMGDSAAARLKSAELKRSWTGREDERSWLAAAAFDARLNDQLEEAGDLAKSLSDTAGPDDFRVLYAQAEAQILGGVQAGWDVLADALAADPRPAASDVWEREELPVLAALAIGRKVKLMPPTHLDSVLEQSRTRGRTGDPMTELHLAARTATIPEGRTAARLTEAALRAISGTADPDLEKLLHTLADEDHLPAQVASLRHHIAAANGQDDQAARAASSDSETPAPEPPVVQLRLPASWLARDARQDAEPRLRELLTWARPRTELFGSSDLEPDGYELLADGKVQASGNADLTLRYCPRGALAALPDRIGKNSRIVVPGSNASIPADLLDDRHDLAVLLTWPAAEVIAAEYYEIVRPRLLPLTLRRLAYRSWKLRGKPAGSAAADWHVARRVLHQFIAEDAYFLWQKRRQPLFRDPLTDWSAAEREITGSETGEGIVPSAVVDERLRLRIAYLHWEKRGRPFGSPRVDWPPS